MAILNARLGRRTRINHNPFTSTQQRIFIIAGCFLLLILLMKGGRKQQLSGKSDLAHNDLVRADLKILYIVTTLAEYDSGRRSTVRGWDRLQGALIPVISEGVRSMLSFGYLVDIVLICGFTMQPERLELVRQGLPEGVGLQVWDDASPLGYKLEDTKANHIQDITRALARQHRFVIKDKLEYYDVFLNFEDVRFFLSRVHAIFVWPVRSCSSTLLSSYLSYSMVSFLSLCLFPCVAIIFMTVGYADKGRCGAKLCRNDRGAIQAT
jgi:hypothetical protein